MSNQILLLFFLVSLSNTFQFRSFQIHGVICPKSKYYDQTCKLMLFTEKYYKGKLLPILLDSKHISGEEVKSLKVIVNCKWELICKWRVIFKYYNKLFFFHFFVSLQSTKPAWFLVLLFFNLGGSMM